MFSSGYFVLKKNYFSWNDMHSIPDFKVFHCHITYCIKSWGACMLLHLPRQSCYSFSILRHKALFTQLHDDFTINALLLSWKAHKCSITTRNVQYKCCLNVQDVCALFMKGLWNISNKWGIHLGKRQLSRQSAFVALQFLECTCGAAVQKKGEKGS